MALCFQDTAAQLSTSYLANATHHEPWQEINARGLLFCEVVLLVGTVVPRQLSFLFKLIYDPAADKVSSPTELSRHYDSQGQHHSKWTLILQRYWQILQHVFVSYSCGLCYNVNEWKSRTSQSEKLKQALSSILRNGSLLWLVSLVWEVILQNKKACRSWGKNPKTQTTKKWKHWR